MQHCNDDNVLLGKTTATCTTAWLAAAAAAATIILLLYNMKLGLGGRREVVIMRGQCGHARKLPLMMISSGRPDSREPNRAHHDSQGVCSATANRIDNTTRHGLPGLASP